MTSILKALLYAPHYKLFSNEIITLKMSTAAEDALRKHALQIFNDSVHSVLPDTMIHSVLQKKNSEICIGRDQRYPLKSSGVTVVGFGKAVIGMARAVQDILKEDIKRGFLNVPSGTIDALRSAGKTNLIPELDGIFEINEGASNNLPDENAKRGAKEIARIADELKDDDIFLVLISGGGSALLPAPIPPITLKEKCDVTKLLANRGADILELNTVRKRLSFLKGGRLAARAKPAKVISFILSDVIGDQLDQIASGPTTEDTDHPNKALDILKRHNLLESMPRSILEELHQQPSTPSTDWSHVQNIIVGSNQIALRTAEMVASKLGYGVLVLSRSVSGEAKRFGEMMAGMTDVVMQCRRRRLVDENLLKEVRSRCHEHNVDSSKVEDLLRLAALHDKVAVVSGGETWVRVTGRGLGGRNQECALSYSHVLQERLSANRPEKVLFLSAGTDGIDGPTTAAGALAYCGQLNGLNCDPASFLADNNSNGFFSRFRRNDLVVTGITGTNVMDIHILLVSTV